MAKPFPALAPFLKGCPEVTTLGIRPSLMDYSVEERRMMRSARLVFFPTVLHARTLQAACIPTFPNFTTYTYRTSRLHQIILFKMAGFPHPKTKVYYGKKRDARILRDFSFPFLILCPSDTTPQGVHEIHSVREFEAYSQRWNPLVVQESIRGEKTLKLIGTNFDLIGASCRESECSHAFPIDPSRLTDTAYSVPTRLTRRLLKAARLDDICAEWIHNHEGWRLLALSRPPVRIPTSDGSISRFAFLCDQIAAGKLGTGGHGDCS